MKQDALTPEELASLLTPPPASESANADSVDFQGQAAFNQWFRTVAQRVAKRLAPLARTEVTIETVDVAPIAYRELIFGVEAPTCFAIVKRSSDETFAVLEIGLPILQPILDRMLGANEPSAIERRPLTEIEQRLAGRILPHWLEVIQDAWPAERDWQLVLHRLESHPARAIIASPDSRFVLARHLITMLDAQGCSHLAFPAAWLDALAHDRDS